LVVGSSGAGVEQNVGFVLLPFGVQLREQPFEPEPTAVAPLTVGEGWVCIQRGVQD
jgi:hypothetical protein